MFENVLIAVDGNAGGRDAITLARKLVSDTGSLTLAHVHGGYPIYAKGMSLAFEQVEQTRAATLLQAAAEQSGVTQTIATGATSVGRGLHHLVETTGADLLVLGSTHRGFAGRVLVADNTREAMNGASCAIAIAPVGYAAQVGPLTRIGVAYNDSDESAYALATARALGARERARLSAVQAITLPAYVYYGLGLPYQEVIDDWKAQAQAGLDALEGVDAHVVYGDAAEELAIYSRSVDLLVLGSRDFGPLGRIVHSSTTVRLTHKACCPLLIMPRAAQAGDRANPSDRADDISVAARDGAREPVAAPVSG